MKEAEHSDSFSVSEITQYIKSWMKRDDVLSAVSVWGEISNCKRHSSGHWYFTLKDEGAEIAAVLFRADALRLTFCPSDGMRVIVYGNIDVYEKSGRYQIYVRAMLADGRGALSLAYERLKQKLSAEGLFAEERKRPLPPFPACVGVITAPTGAAIRDIVNITGRRYPQAKILLYPSSVQGADAPASLCAGLSYLNADQSCNVIILGRGGGSVEDLWAFNDENLVRMVASSRIPVISAVGHETDYTLCDFAADCRAPTPSAAAELAVPNCGELLERLRQRQSYLNKQIVQQMAERQHHVENCRRQLEARSPKTKLDQYRQQVSHSTQMLSERADRILERKKSDLRNASERLEALNPLAILQRGYSAVQNEEGKLVKSVSGLHTGQSVTLVFSDGFAQAQITSCRQTISKQEKK